MLLLGLLAQNLQKENNEYQKYLLGILKSLPNFSELHSKVSKETSRLKIRVDYSIYSSGVHYMVPYYSQNLPNSRKKLLNWGSKLLFTKTTIDGRTKNSIYAYTKDIIEKILI